MLSIADRYVFWEWLKIFGLVLGAMFGLQFIVEVQDSFTDLLGYDAGVGVIFFYYAVLAPSFLTISLPASILVSILYALGVLHRNNEFIAFRSAGMSVFRITRSVWFAGIMLSGMLLFLNASLIPWSKEQSRQLWERLEFSFIAESEGEENVGINYSLAFDNRKENRMWFLNRYSEYNGMAHGITVSEMDSERRETRRILARDGYYSEVDGHWILRDGRDNFYVPENGELRRTVPFDRIELDHLNDDPSLMLLFGEQPKDLSFLELKRIVENFDVEENPKVLEYQVEMHKLMASAALCLIVTGLAIPFAIAGVRTNPAVGVSKSIGLFFSYYIFASVLNALGRQAFLSPAIAAWTPPVVMIIMTYVFMRRVR